jgi:hypothetical protein
MNLLPNPLGMVATVAKRWRRQYYRDGQWYLGMAGGKDAEGIHRQLLGLDLQTATPEDVERIIGSASWCAHWCHECWSYKPIAVEFCETGERVIVCDDCLAQAVALVKASTVQEQAVTR